jgi:hypothetical protein
MAARWKLVASTAEATQAHPLEAMLNLQVGKDISTFLRSLLDRSNSGVPVSERA